MAAFRQKKGKNYIDLPLQSVRRVAPQHGDRIVTIDNC